MQDLERERREAEEHKSKIESARDRLYQPGGPSVIHKELDSHLPKDEEEVNEPSQIFAPPPVTHTFDQSRVVQKVNKVFRKLLIAAIVFFVIALGVAGFMYFYGNNIISSRNIQIDITAPSSIPSSDTFTFDVSVQNGNNSDLIKSAIVIDYPEGARYVEDNTKPLVSERIEIGTLTKGQIIKKTVSARLFGEENTDKGIKVRFEYQVDNSNAHFSKDQDFNVILRLAPVVLSIDALSEVNNNQEVLLTAKVISNSNNTLNNVALNVVYPFGFTYKESNLEVDGKVGEFPLGELKPNETKTVEIRGTINGQSAEDKVFKFNVESGDTPLALYDHNMVIRGDFLASSITFNDNKNYGALGDQLRGTISWKNTLKDPINNAEFALKISGDLFKPEDVGATGGFYDSSKSIIEWNKDTDRSLEEIAPGQTGRFSFSIPLLGYDEAILRRISNPKIDLTFDIEGQRITERDVTENIRSSFTKTVPMITTVDFDSFSLHDTGPQKNTGPYPPKAENKTTFTIALSLSNSINQITNGEVVTKLPNYVTFENEIYPSSDKVDWNNTTRLLRWNVGTIPPRTGYGTVPRTLYFKVSISPSRTQIGQVLQLVNSIAFTGTDSFANTTLSEDAPNVISTTKDQASGLGNGQVVQ